MPFAASTAYGASGGMQVGAAGIYPDSFEEHAILWNGTANHYVDLNPPGFAYSGAFAASGSHQVGYATTEEFDTHAMLWNGTAASAVDLHPAGFMSSYAQAVSGNSQVGRGAPISDVFYIPPRHRALLWHGSAESVVDLHPDGFLSSEARAVSGNIQVGSGFSNAIGTSHALLWTGTAESVVDLHSAEYGRTVATGVYGNTQVGTGYFDENPLNYFGSSRALMWHGTAESVVSLHPPTGYGSSSITAISGNVQVGFGGGFLQPTHALVWNGTAESYLDLHPFLSSVGNFIDSTALGISENGDIVGYAYNEMQDSRYAVKWSPVPGPGVHGDYNNDGAVDAADYVMWRKGASPLANEVETPGSITDDDHDAWATRFGNHSGTVPTNVPEPTGALFILSALGMQGIFRRRPR